MLTTRQNRAGLGALANLVGNAAMTLVRTNPALAEGMLTSGGQLVNRARDSLLGFPAQGNMPSANISKQARNMFRTQNSRGSGRTRKPRARRGVGREQLTSQIVSDYPIPRAIRQFQPRQNFVFTVPLNTLTTTGAFASNFWPGYADTAYDNSMSSISTQYSNLAGIFRYQTFHAITVEWVPLTPYTTSGWAGIQVYPDPTIAAVGINNVQLFTERDCGVVSDVKKPCKLKWVPQTEEERETKEIATATGVVNAPRRNFAPCIVYLSVIGTNLTAAATLAGHFVITCDITLSGLL
jgi:hypothetical protein